MGSLWALEWRKQWFLGFSYSRASREASANFFLWAFRDILLVPDLWTVYGIFEYATDDQP